MKFYVIAGEASGDLHGSNLLKQIASRQPSALFRGFGGDLMQGAGMEVVRHYRDTSFMGFTEVLANIRTILGLMDFCRKDILQYKPHALILIDYPGFNLRMARFASKAGIPVFYYISPQVWAWKRSRVYQIRRYVNRMLVILPFEEAFYARYNYQAHFVGHPLLDVISRGISITGSAFREKNRLDARPLIALLPGSRKQEIKTMLPVMLKMTARFTDYQFVVAAAPSVDEEFYSGYLAQSGATLVENQTYELLGQAHAAVVTSGTASLETALWGVPQVICYRGSLISYHIARQLVTVPYIGLPNLILGREVVRELIQQDFTAENLSGELQKLTCDDAYRAQILSDYSSLWAALGGKGASQRAACQILEYLNDSKC